MRAVLCRAYGPPESLVVEEVDAPTAGPGQVVVDVEACGLNFPDLLMIQDLYQFKPELPFSPGAEIAGTVSEVGADVDGALVGTKVFATTGGVGGLAERVAVAARSVVPLPEGLDVVPASGLQTTYGTSYHALVDRAHLQSGETLLVLGAAGGVGLAAVELGVLLGASVIAAASTDEKLALCRARGAAMTINYETEDLKARIRDLTEGHGADVIYDPVGGAYSEPALRSIAWDGRFLVVGFAAGEIPRIPLNLPLLKQCSVVGVFYGAFAGREPARVRANLAQLLEWCRSGRLQPYVSATYPLAETGVALRQLADRKAEGKVVVLVNR